MPTQDQIPQDTQDNLEPSSDESAATEGAAAESATAEGGQAGTSDSESGGSLLDTGGIEDQGGASAEADDASPSDWRDEFSGGDEKLKNVISRYRSPKDVAKALSEAKNFIRANRAGVQFPGEDASEEELLEFRKSMNIPDDHKDYEVEWGEGAEPSETDLEILDTFAGQMHKVNATPKQLQAAVDWYNDQLRATEQERLERRHETQVETQTTLKAEWGGEYKSNLNAIKQFIVGQMDGDEDAATQLFRTPLADGSMLGDHLPFIKMMATPAVDYVGPNAIFSGDPVKITSTLLERKDQLLELRNTDPDKYGSERVQKELNSIYHKLDLLEKQNKGR